MKSILLVSVILQCMRLIFSDELVGVAVIVNHGEIVPRNFYRKDPYRTPFNWQNLFGHLSNLGKQQTYEVGKWLQKRYDRKIPFLSLHYNASQVYTFSEDRDPSLMSAECLMAGLYPPVGDEIWNPKINWRPTPVHTEPLFLDNAVGRGVNCPNYGQLLAKVQRGRFLRKHNREEQLLLKYLSLHTGERFTNIDQIPALYNALTVEQNNNFTLPNWTLAVYPDALEKIVLELSTIRSKNQELTKLSIGPILQKIQEQFEAIITNSPNLGNLTMGLRKFKVYVANDTLIYDILHGLKVSPVEVVSSGASLIFELWRPRSEMDYVKLLYRSTPKLNYPSHNLKIGGCKSAKCPYSKFNSTLSTLGTARPEWIKLCQIIPTNSNSITNNTILT